MIKSKVLSCVKQHGQIVDSQIALELSLDITDVRTMIAALVQTKEVYTCNIINFENGIEKSSILCRLSGYCPPAATGRKPTK